VKQAIGRISHLFRYPVKSMAGIALDAATAGWHGVQGDRRFAIHKMADHGGFPWLTAGRLHDLVRYQPFGASAVDPLLPTHVRTPDGNELELQSRELQDELSRRFGSDVELMHLKHGIFDEAPISVISSRTIHRIAEECGRPLDVRRFRPNIIVDPDRDLPFAEDAWVGKSVILGTDADAPVVSITLRDVRCAMLNLDPETAQSDPNVLKAAVRLNTNCAGVYGAVIREGKLSVGQQVFLSS
jgi:uncharacterized protein YcbX